MCTLLVFNLFAHNSFAAIGETYDQMVQRHGKPLQVEPEHVVNTGTAAKYKKEGVKSYVFNIDKFKIYALFNANNICFMMVTHRNIAFPNKSLFLGKLADTTPKVLVRIPRRLIKLQYGNGANAVIYESSGRPGDLNALAFSKALEPK